MFGSGIVHLVRNESAKMQRISTNNKLMIGVGKEDVGIDLEGAIAVYTPGRCKP